jgi:hypothetical protein
VTRGAAVSSTKNAVHAAWFPASTNRVLLSQDKALECVQQALEAIEGGRPLPPEPAGVFSRALRGYLSGRQRDITRALGLRPRRGGATEEPVRAAQLTARNQSIQRLFDLASGSACDRADAVARWIVADSPSEITEADVRQAVAAFREQHSGRAPSSGRQVLRIVRSLSTDH